MSWADINSDETIHMAKAKIIESADKFLELLKRSQLLADNQLEAVRKLTESSPDPLPIARTLVKNGWLTKWQASQLLSGFYNLTLGKYRLADHLGRGELGNVYLAENPKLGRQVALKTLSRKHTEAPDVVDRFLKEARAAAALDHRNIVHVHDVSSEGQRHYVVMEYVTGQNLQNRVEASGPFAFDKAANVIRQAAEGLDFAHKQGVLHRDIKPANIMLDDQGVAKILDIGVGHLRRSESKPAGNTGELMMSAIAYMAPEHARGEDVDARCDVYSLGGVLYFLLIGRTPFSTRSDAERTKIKESKRPTPLSELRAETPPPLVDLCDAMMALKPEERLTSMSDVLAALASEVTFATGTASGSETETLSEAEAGNSEDEVEVAEPKVEPNDSAAFEAESKSSGESGETPVIKIDVGDSARPAVAVAPVDFAINTKRRKKKPASKPAAKAEPGGEEPAATKESELAAADVSSADDTPEPVAVAPKRISKGLMIGAACVAGLLLIGIGAGAMMLLRGSDQQISQAGPGTTENSGTGSAHSEHRDTATETSTGEAPEVDGASTEDTDSNVASAFASAAVPEPGTQPAAEVAAAAAAQGDLVVAEPPASTGTTVATEAPSEPAAAQQEPAPEPPAEPMPEPPTAAADERPTEGAPTPDKNPEPDKTPKKVPKPATFVFQPAVDLPVPAADAPELTLGKINIREEDTVFIGLDGGDIAAAGRYEFSLQPAQDGIAPRDWEFYLSDGSADPVIIATMSLPEKDLKFKWAPAAVENPTATNLRNCSLKITAGQDQPQDLSLRIAQKVAPITIDVEKPATAKLPLEGAPDRSSLKMEVTVKGHKSMVEPAQIELGKGGEGVIYFGESPEQSALALKLDANINARGVQIKTEPYFLVPGERAPVRLNKGSIKKYEAYQAQQAGLQNQVIGGEKAVNDKRLSPQDKARGQAILAGMKQQLELIDKTVERMAQLNTDMAAVGSGASLQFRVFSDTFERQIDLIVTDPNAAPVAP